MTLRLTAREHEILCEVVRLYLGRGEPVASGAVARMPSISLSSASIRNTMASLEERGLLEQPHASAGRVPSDLGLRVFVDELVSHVSLPAGEEERLRTMLPFLGSLETRVEHATKVLAQVTRLVGLALRPAAQQGALRSIHFARVSDQQVLAVLVTLGGVVDSRILDVERPFAPEELERISNYCTGEFGGLTLPEIRERLHTLLAQERARCDEILTGVLQLAPLALDLGDGGAAELVLEGLEHLLGEADGAHLESLRSIVAAFSEKTALLQLLDEFLAQRGPWVVLGSQMAFVGASDMGMILSSFQLAGGETGLVGVIGLRHMNYPYLIPMVDFVGQRLSGGEP
jgi:heat-inducible transcriptional repressor